MKNQIIKIVTFGLTLFIYSCRDCASGYYNEIKPSLIAGRLHYKYEDKTNHNAPTFVILNGGKYKRYPLFGLSNMLRSVDVGDSIFKGNGTLKFLVVKNDTVMEFWPMCNKRQLSDE